MDYKRLVLVMGLLLSIFLALSGRIFYYQIIRGEEIARQATAMRSRSVELREYPRGDIVDRNLLSLTGRTSTALYAANGLIRSVESQGTGGQQGAAGQIQVEWQEFLEQTLDNKDGSSWAEALKDAVPGLHYTRLKSDLSAEEIERIDNAQIDGLIIAPFVNRYREEGFCAHLLGYVDQGAGGQGQAGLEKAYNEILQNNSSAPTLVSMVDAKGRAINGLAGKLQSKPHGKGTVVLTIDKRIQTIVEKAMDKRVEKGAVVVMDIYSKEVLAMASRPTFNPYRVNDVIAFDDRSPLTNRALSRYNPGSIFKILLSLAVLEEGLASPEEMFNCTGEYIFNNQVTMACWREGGHGNLSLAQGFANSCNPAFIEVGLRLGTKQVLNYVDKLHLTDETIIGYYPGNMGTYVEIEGGEPALGNASLGQKGVMISPMQIASLVSTVADNGYWGPPSLVKYTVDQNGTVNLFPAEYREQVISSVAASQVRRFMETAVEEGTGKGAIIAEAPVAGKTGTSQTGRITNDNEEVLNVWFAGYLPADQPRWAVVVMAEEGSSGAQDCAPVFREISRGILQLY